MIETTYIDSMPIMTLDEWNAAERRSRFLNVAQKVLFVVVTALALATLTSPAGGEKPREFFNPEARIDPTQVDDRTPPSADYVPFRDVNGHTGCHIKVGDTSYVWCEDGYQTTS